MAKRFRRAFFRGWPRSSRRRCRRCAASRGWGRASARSAISSPSASTTPTMPPSRACRSRKNRSCSTRRPPCIVGPNDDIVIPKGSEKTDWEVELAIVIGSRASYVGEARRARTRRRLLRVQRRLRTRLPARARRRQWIKGKGCPTFGPLGPWLVTADEIPDPQKLSMWLDVNGERMQSGSTATMIFDVRTLVSYISHFMILEPGDVITTGTPPGVGSGKKPPRFLKPGDTISLGVEGLGQQAQRVIAWAEERLSRDEGDEVGDRRDFRRALRGRVRRGLRRLSRQGGAMARRHLARPRRPALHAGDALARRRLLRFFRRRRRRR